MRFIFVGGCGRSGTTLVQKLLSQHSHIVGGPEFDHTKDIFTLYQKMSNDYYLERQSNYYTKEYLDECFLKFYEAFFENLVAQKPDATYISEKTPANIDVANILLKIFPGSIFVNVVRDGRDVLLSYLNIRSRRMREGEKIHTEWKTIIRISRRWIVATNKFFNLNNNPELSPRVYSIRFEDLLENAEQELFDLFTFLELEFEPHLLHPEEIKYEDVGFTLKETHYTREMFEQPFNTTRIGRWRTDMGKLVGIITNTLMAQNLIRLQYEVPPFYLCVSNALHNTYRNRYIRKLVKAR